MANKKTSDFNDAATLTGPEIIGIVQSGVDVKTTFANVKSGIVGNPTEIAIGKNSGQSGSKTVSIGAYTYTVRDYGISIGYDSHSRGKGAVVIGAYSSTALCNQGSVIIGYNTSGQSPGQTILGSSAYGGNYATYSVALGNHARSLSESSIAIGNRSYSTDVASIGIGNYSSARGGGIAIGNYSEHHSSFQSITIGHSSSTTNSYSSVVIGQNASSQHGDMNVVIGKESYAGYGGDIGNNSVAIGSYSVAIYGDSTAIGSGAYSGYRATSVGRQANAHNYGIAVGFEANASNYSITIGNNLPSGTQTISIGSPAFGLYSIRIGKGGSTAGNEYSVVLGHEAYDLSRGSFVVTGHPNSFYSFTTQQKTISLKLTGYTSVDHTIANLTTNGNESDENAQNYFQIDWASIAYVTGTIIGLDTNTLNNFSGNVASFTLSPILIQRNNTNGHYNIVGTPEFVLSQSTDGAESWTVPTLEYDSGNNRIVINTFDQGSGDLVWLAYLTIETHNGSD